MVSRRTNWTEEEEKQLFELHKEFGNKWSIIASRMPEKNDSCIKNKFYSTLRKGLRKINSYVTNVKKKSDPAKYKAYKPFPELFLTKIISVVDRNFDQKFEVKPRAIELAFDIQTRIVEVACSATEYLKPQAISYNSEEVLLGDIQEFNKNCKKRKGKRKQAEDKANVSDNDEEQPHMVRKLEESEMLSQFEPPYVYKIPSFQTEKVLEKSNEKGESKPTTVQISNSQDKIEEQLFSIRHLDNGLCTVNKQSSVATTVIENNSRQFASKAQEFFRVMEDNPMTHSSNMSMSNSWIYDSSGDLSRRANNLFQPSPLPSSDSYSPFSFTNLMKNHNVTLSSQFDQKNNSIDLFSSSKLYQSKRQQNVLSLVDQLPLYQANRANFLVKSEDLLKSTDLVSKISETSCKETASATPFQTKTDQSALNQFLAGFSGMSFIGGSFDEKIKEYSFGNNSEACGPKQEN